MTISVSGAYIANPSAKNGQYCVQACYTRIITFIFHAALFISINDPVKTQAGP